MRAMPTDADDLVGAAEASGVIGCDRSTLMRWVRDGLIPATRVGAGPTGAYAFRRSDVEDLAKRFVPKPRLRFPDEASA